MYVVYADCYSVHQQHLQYEKNIYYPNKKNARTRINHCHSTKTTIRIKLNTLLLTTVNEMRIMTQK